MRLLSLVWIMRRGLINFSRHFREAVLTSMCLAVKNHTKPQKSRLKTVQKLRKSEEMNKIARHTHGMCRQVRCVEL